ncbi:unnamed protein product [Paramecium sonneborni]|uniref:Uncharacterized protein n=1 Tax=Paramecium sonneborni TaxID=65129 RepID=A0A8S1K1H2_9CILI|nr:unnamed protein product [Paramecium sonneborni]
MIQLKKSQKSYNTLYNRGFKILNEQLQLFFYHKNQMKQLIFQNKDRIYYKQKKQAWDYYIIFNLTLEAHVRDQIWNNYSYKNQYINHQLSIYPQEVKKLINLMEKSYNKILVIWQGYQNYNHILWGQYTFEENGQKKNYNDKLEGVQHLMVIHFKDNLEEVESKEEVLINLVFEIFILVLY